MHLYIICTHPNDDSCALLTDKSMEKRKWISNRDERKTDFAEDHSKYEDWFLGAAYQMEAGVMNFTSGAKQNFIWEPQLSATHFLKILYIVMSIITKGRR